MKKEIEGNPVCLFRCRDAGVLFGKFMAQDENWVYVGDCRRIWCWYGAQECNEIAVHGLGKRAEESRISVMTTEMHLIRITDICEIIAMHEKPTKQLYAMPEWRA